MDKAYWKVGELAKRTGLTVRTLHHYDRKGLVSPSGRSESGHRLYVREDIARLQQVLSLKQLGFSLDEIKELMCRDDYDPAEVLRVQMERLQDAMRRQEQLYGRLEELHSLISRRQQVTTEQFMKSIEVMKMNPSLYFTEEQLERLRARGEALGPDKLKEVANEWPGLIENVRRRMNAGAPTDDAEVLKLARRWQELTNLFSGGDPAVIRAAERFHGDNPGNELQHGMDGELYRYISQAIAHLS